MERDKAALGGGPPRVRERHVERRWLRHQLPLRRHHRPEDRRLLQGQNLLYLFKKKSGYSRPFSVIFRLFVQISVNFLQQIIVKNNLVYGAGIRTHDL